MIATLVLYGLAFVGALSLITAVGVLVFTWRLPERTDPGVIDEQRHEFEHAQWRNHVRVVPTRPDSSVGTCPNCGRFVHIDLAHACPTLGTTVTALRTPDGAA